MIDVGALYVDTLGLDHWVFPIKNVAQKSHHTDTAGQGLAPPTTNTYHEQSHEVCDALGTIEEPSIAIATTDRTKLGLLVVDTAPLAKPSTLSADPAQTEVLTAIADDTATDPDNPTNDGVATDSDTTGPPDDPIPVTSDDESKVEVSKTLTAKERSNPSLG